MKLGRIMKGIKYEIVQHGDEESIESLAIDSRKVEEGCLFICLRGLTVDGHRFIDDAFRQGAVAVLVDSGPVDSGLIDSGLVNSEPGKAYPPGLNVLKVEDTRLSLAAIAANFYGSPASSLRLFGVTGTNGKTSVTYMMDAILRQVGKSGIIGTVGLSLGGKVIDIPFTTSTTPDPQELQQIFGHIVENGGQDVVMEVSSHALALHKMEGLFFEVAMFTNLTQDHLDFHGTMENYLAAKAKLFGQCRYGVVNADDKYSSQIMTIGNPEKWITYGIDSDCDIRAVHIEDRAGGSAFDVEIDGELMVDGVMENFFLPVKGRFNIYNALAAIGAALTVGISIEDIRTGLLSFEGVPGRIQSVPNDKGLSVFVDYAHSPDGLVNIINAVRAFTEGRVITVFGCGGDRDKEKRPIMGRIAGELSDHCIITSDNPRSEPPEIIISQAEEGVKDTSCPYDAITDRRDAIFQGIAMLEADDALIIAGKGHENYQEINGQTLPFDDVEVAKEALCQT